MSYSLNQYPKNKIIKLDSLNEYQVEIRNNLKHYIYKDYKTCNKCFIKQPIDEFYVKDKKTGRRSNGCRDCQLKSVGVVEIGKLRFADEILKKDFKNCSVCKNIKPLIQFRNNKGRRKGKDNVCIECSRYLGYKYYKEKNGIDVSKKDYKKHKYFIDNRSFKYKSELCRYIKKEYGIPITTTEYRIKNGYNVEDLKLSKNYVRIRTNKNRKNK